MYKRCIFFCSFLFKIFNNIMFNFLNIKNIVLLNYHMDVYNLNNYIFHFLIVLKNTFFFNFNIIYNYNSTKKISLILSFENRNFCHFYKN